MRLEKVADIDVLSIIISMIEYGTDAWVVRAARLISGWCTTNLRIQNLILDTNLIQPLVQCLKGGSTLQKTHAGLALLHICHQNNETRYECRQQAFLAGLEYVILYTNMG